MPIPLSLYIHLPWCVKKCPYCDFNSHVLQADESQEEKYIDALITDIEIESEKIQERLVQTVFFGGGTPSLFSVEGIAKILQAVNKTLNVSDDVEITLEANPGTAEAEKFIGFYEQGINRLSIGVQSFSDDKLSALGRIHNSEQAIKAIKLAKNAGFNNFNIDLMYGLPEQTQQQALADLQKAIELEAMHISWYELTIEPNTIFYSKPPVLPDDDNVWEMHLAGKELLEQHEYKQYEVSAYGKKHCRHNVNYWQFGDYLGIGAGAHSKLSNLLTKQVERFARVKLPQSYIDKVGNNAVYAEHRIVSESDLIFEFMLNALRLSQGFELDLFEQRTGLGKQYLSQAINIAQERNWIELKDEIVNTTSTGKQYLNEVVKLFLLKKE